MRKRWKSLVHTPDGLDRRFYGLCVLSELKNALRSGDIWVQRSRQFKDFEEYLISASHFAVQRAQEKLGQKELGLAVETDGERFLQERLSLLGRELATVERLAAVGALPDAAVTSSGRHQQRPSPAAAASRSRRLTVPSPTRRSR